VSRFAFWPLDRRLVEPQGQSGHGGKEKKPCPCLAHSKEQIKTVHNIK